MTAPEDYVWDAVAVPSVTDTESEGLRGEVTDGVGVVSIRISVPTRVWGRFARGGRFRTIDVFTLGVFARQGAISRGGVGREDGSRLVVAIKARVALGPDEVTPSVNDK